MKNKTSLVLAFILLLGLGLFYLQQGQPRPDLLPDMAELDRYYIPVLALTSQEKLAPARKAMQALLPQWQGFVAKHAGMQQQDAKWQGDMARVDGHVQAAARLVAEGSDLKAAHEELESLRVLMLQVRERNGVDYFIDHLTHFHEPMEAIVLRVKDKQPAQLTEEDRVYLQAELVEAHRLWKAVREAPLDPQLFKLDAAGQAALQQALDQEQQALERLHQALQGEDAGAVIKAGVAIKPVFARTFMSFGDFSPYK